MARLVRKSDLGIRAGRTTFNDAYQGVPPWDIGKPQPEIVRLARAEAIRGRVLDVGCGTGENAIFLAAKGHDVLGIDASPLAIEKAKQKATTRRSAARFAVADALHLEALGERFESAIDSGLFHTFLDPERAAYVKSVRAALRSGGTFHLICFSDREPDWGGPRRVKREEIEASFSDGWKVQEIRPVRFSTNFEDGDVDGWSATIIRLPDKGGVRRS